MTNAIPDTTPRGLRDAMTDAFPDALAAIACAVAWKQPDAPGFDLLGIAGLLYFIELPLAILVGFAGVRRARHGTLTRRDRIWIVLFPALLLAAASTLLLGIAGLVAIAWLGAVSLARELRDTPHADPAVTGLWLVFGKRGAAISFDVTPRRPSNPGPGVVVVPAGHEQLMACATIGTWIVIPIVFAILPAFGVGGASADYALGAGWDATLVGRWVPAHLALAAGLILFAVRTLGHFEGIGEPPPVRVEEDELLQEVVEKVEGRPLPQRGRRKR
jgi:hypothetical protein